MERFKYTAVLQNHMLDLNHTLEIKGIIFDIGNVIQPESELDKSAKIMGVSTDTFEFAFMKDRKNNLDLYQIGEISSEKFAFFVLENIGLENSEENKRLFTRAIANRWEEPKFEVIQIIKTVKPKIKKAILSNCLPELEKYANSFNGTKLGYLPLFGKHAYLSHLINARKPEEKAYLSVTNGLELISEECLFIDDKEKYVIAAQKEGLHGLVYENPSQLEQALRKYLVI